MLGLLFLVMFITAVLGCFLFKSTIHGVVIEPKYMNFKNVGFALVTLFRCSTGENWHQIMEDLIQDRQNSCWWYQSIELAELCRLVVSDWSGRSRNMSNSPSARPDEWVLDMFLDLPGQSDATNR